MSRANRSTYAEIKKKETEIKVKTKFENKYNITSN